MEAPEVFHDDGFGRKFGPLPIWGWALILAAGVFIYIRFFGGSSAGASGASTSALPNIMTTGGYLPASTGSAAPSGSAGYTDNQSWENAALQQASTYGTDPVTLQGALDTYQAGGTLSPTQSSLVDKVIEAIGAAPTGTLGTPVVSGTPTAQPLALTGISNGKGSLGFMNTNNGKSVYAPNVVEYQYLSQVAQGSAHPNQPNITATQLQDALALEGQLK